MKYDDASWHYGAEDFPQDLPEEAGGVHIGMFFAWLINEDFLSEEFLEDFEDDAVRLKNRDITGTDALFLIDGKFIDVLLNDEGNAFTSAYYNNSYYNDYFDLFQEYDSYSVEDTWANYDRLVPIIDKAYNQWLALGRPEILAKTSESASDLPANPPSLWKKITSLFGKG